MYRGRFAPSPTGPLHFGSLVAAVGSFLQARAQGGEWLVRMEDIDPPREMKDAADDILRTLEAYELHWDGTVMYQSRRHEAYAEALEQLRAAEAVYACSCTRREIADSSVRGIEGPIYPGTCRRRVSAPGRMQATRVRTDGARLSFEDAVQGRISADLEAEIGDFVVRRSDGHYAYQLAVVVDDQEQGITEVVRGADLLASTARQIHVQQLLGAATPRYVHLPAAVNAQGEKLSKQTYAPAVSRTAPIPMLLDALAFLGHPVPRDVQEGALEDIWTWAIATWDLARVPRERAIAVAPEASDGK